MTKYLITICDEMTESSPSSQFVMIDSNLKHLKGLVNK